MKRAGYPWIEIVVLVVLAAFLLAGAADVPFHPDESSWLFQSRDLESLLAHPLSLSYRANSEPSAEMTYRLLNAPLAKYVLAAARSIVGVPASGVEADWDWSKTWGDNVAAGALPARATLAAARTSSALLVLLAVVALYYSGVFLGGRATGLAAAVFLGTNALVLLHGRRAMAEGALLLAVSLALLGLLHAARHPWLAGLAAGLAFSAKTSAGVWIPLGWAASAWSSEPGMRSWRASLGRVGGFTLAAGAITLVLSPILWREPFGALAEMWRARQALVAAQVDATRAVMPWAVLDSPGQRGATLLVNLYISPLQFAEAANYVRETAAAEASYQANPFHTSFRGLAGGAVQLALTLVGIALGLRRARLPDPEVRRTVALCLLATIVQAAALVLAVPLAFQRYVIPLVPLVCLWSGYAVTGIVDAVTRNRRPETGPAVKSGA